MRRILVVDDDLHVGQAIMGVRGDTAVSSARAHGALDRAFGYAFSDTETLRPRIPQAGHAAWRHVPSAQAVQAYDFARRDRRMPVAGRAAPSQRWAQWQTRCPNCKRSRTCSI
jgi:hypothetical protein